MVCRPNVFRAPSPRIAAPRRWRWPQSLGRKAAVRVQSTARRIVHDERSVTDPGARGKACSTGSRETDHAARHPRAAEFQDGHPAGLRSRTAFVLRQEPAQRFTADDDAGDRAGAGGGDLLQRDARRLLADRRDGRHGAEPDRLPAVRPQRGGRQGTRHLAHALRGAGVLHRGAVGRDCLHSSVAGDAAVQRLSAGGRARAASHAHRGRQQHADGGDCRHPADHPCRAGALCADRRHHGAGDGRHRHRRADPVCYDDLPALPGDLPDARLPGGEGRDLRRTGASQGDLRRGAPQGRAEQPRQVALPGDHEPRAAHAAQCHHRLFRSAQGRDHGSAPGRGLQGIRRRHPQVRPAPAQSHQRDPRPVAHRGRPPRVEGGSVVWSRRCRTARGCSATGQRKRA